MARRPRLAVAAATAAVLALLVEVYRLDATLGRFLTLLIVTPLAFVAFERWISSSAERPASGGAGALKCRQDGYRARIAHATRSAGQRR